MKSEASSREKEHTQNGRFTNRIFQFYDNEYHVKKPAPEMTPHEIEYKRGCQKHKKINNIRLMS